MQSQATHTNVDQAELAKFSDLAHRWWDPESEFRPLHQINPLRLDWINGIAPLQMFFKIRLPFAVPSIMAGINQSLMMAFGMVVIAGIVGSGGLGQTIYEAIRTLDIAMSIDATIAIVILTMVLDRLTQSAGSKKTGGTR